MEDAPLPLTLLFLYMDLSDCRIESIVELPSLCLFLEDALKFDWFVSKIDIWLSSYSILLFLYKFLFKSYLEP